jgi:hypothetical protein
VRVSVSDGRRLTGRVEQVTADTLVLLPEGQTAGSGAISLGLQHDQVGDGSSVVGSAVALGAWSGMLFGGLIGAAIGAGHSGERWERVR